MLNLHMRPPSTPTISQSILTILRPPMVKLEGTPPFPTQTHQTHTFLGLVKWYQGQRYVLWCSIYMPLYVRDIMKRFVGILLPRVSLYRPPLKIPYHSFNDTYTVGAQFPAIIHDPWCLDIASRDSEHYKCWNSLYRSISIPRMGERLRIEKWCHLRGEGIMIALG